MALATQDLVAELEANMSRVVLGKADTSGPASGRESSDLPSRK